MVVRRPASPEPFSGVVWVEWQNVTLQRDADAVWAMSHEHLIRRGYAWVGVSAQRAGIHSPASGLKTWCPTRYGTLDVTENGAILDDALSYDIFSQAAQAIRTPAGVDPMGGLEVKLLLAVGGSQSATRLANYYNSIQSLASVVDGFVLASGGGLLRTDLAVKMFKLLSETEIAGNQTALRQPDSDRFRRWEAAGSSHVSFRMQEEIGKLEARDIGPTPPPACDRPPLSRIPTHFLLNAAMDHMVRWVRDNIPPPGSPEIEVTALGPPVVIARDLHGNALGGIRLSQHTVPTATNAGVNSGPGTCALSGSYQPFHIFTVNDLYPDQLTYVTQVIQVTLDNLKAGYLVPEDAVTTISDVVDSGVGKW
ncbi:MAG: hypothetical protein HY820_00060 [Acidobacteria bacterium]|nr:hypothetical protein [Acidobacteriota bacterium]